MDLPAQPARTLHWAGTDDPGRRDTAVVSFRETELAASGTSTCDDYSATWTLNTSPGWVTRRLQVEVTGPGWSRSLELTRSVDGRWDSQVTASGNPDLPAPGIEDPLSLDNAQDCDLGLCPLTNTMPILRLDLLNHAAPPDETRLTMAWVEMPSLRVLASEQVYSQVSPYREERGNAIVLYSSATRGFTAELTVDADGAVIDYPGLARRTG
ncbi:putative glycolipid-binding domain-containing protein [Arthrobacter sp. 7Tela_A1]|uniref:putative glycolipid-binding domain-containing protein n=1 Tax=Arthrobacter sp. 7Tela_A1 TaxID=3093745 RepID=UPI003BB72D04